MLNNTKKILSLFILLMGAALVTRAVLAFGVSFNLYLFAGLAFMLYGGARLYYAARDSG